MPHSRRTPRRLRCAPSGPRTLGSPRPRRRAGPPRRSRGQTRASARCRRCTATAVAATRIREATGARARCRAVAGAAAGWEAMRPASSDPPADADDAPEYLYVAYADRLHGRVLGLEPDVVGFA